jgi:hypothetical protein
MSSFKNIAEIEAVFGALHLSPIEKGMKDIQTAKQGFNAPSGGPSTQHRVVLTNGTGTIKETSKNAELERRISRTTGL